MDTASHTLTVLLPEEPLPIEGDLDRFTQVMTNLLGNAAKFTDAGGPVEVRVSRVGNGAQIGVRDNGIEIAPDQLGTAFEPFVRGRAVSGQTRQGWGIGLAVVQGIIEAHGGTVWAESGGPGRGSTFVVRLPLAEDVD